MDDDRKVENVLEHKFVVVVDRDFQLGQKLKEGLKKEVSGCMRIDLKMIEILEEIFKKPCRWRLGKINSRRWWH